MVTDSDYRHFRPCGTTVRGPPGLLLIPPRAGRLRPEGRVPNQRPYSLIFVKSVL